MPWGKTLLFQYIHLNESDGFGRVTPHGGKELHCVNYRRAKKRTLQPTNQPTNNHTVIKHIQSEPPMNSLSEGAREIAGHATDVAKDAAQRATDAAKDVTGVVEDVANDVSNTAKHASNRASDAAKDMYQSLALKTEDTLATTKDFVRRNPVPVVIGAVAFGVAIGYMLLMSRRKPTFGERYVDEPLVAVREALLGALAPVAKRVHKGYDSARDGAEKAMDRVHGYSPGRTCNSISDQMGRIGNNLKFW